jgi:hypothetical protein
MQLVYIKIITAALAELTGARRNKRVMDLASNELR